MAWTEPRAWRAGELVAPADMNTHLSDNHTHLKIPLDSAGKLVSLTASYVADLSGAGLSGVLRLALDNAFTAGKTNFGGGAATRIVVPVGADKWGT